jgi:methylamine dehydrogenase accessory protein MauD
LVLFIVGIGTNLARGRRPDCHCFGQLHSSPAGWNTLLRNGVLAGVAAFVVWEGKEGAGPSSVSWLGTLSAAQLLGPIVGLIVLGLLAGTWWFLAYVLRQNGRLLVRLEALEDRLDAAGVAPSPNEAQQAGLPIGTEAPDFSLQGLYGETHTLEALRAPDKPVMLLFTDPDCGQCNALLPEIGRWQQEHAEKLTISLISRGTPEENRTKTTEHGVTNVVLQEDRELSEEYLVATTPSAVLINPDGKIGSYVASGPEAIEVLVEDALKPRVGDPAPEIKLPELSGETIELEDFEGEKTLVLFWNPGCGFCQRMLDDLKALESDPPTEASRILVVSGGTVEDNEAMGLSSPVVLDQQFAVGRAFGAFGTPSAVLVDEEGKVASEVAVGDQEVLALAKQQDRQAGVGEA